MATETFKLDLDNDDFLKKLLDSVSGLKNLGDVKNIQSLLSGLGAAVEITGALGAAFLVAKAAIDMTAQAEQIKQVNDEFVLLTQNAGLSTQTLYDGLTKASNGLISDTDLLKLANKAIIELGDNANKLPEIMELARKATSAFGGDLAQNFQGINQAIATGNTRILKHMGIIIDANKAYRDYAASINTTVGALSESGKQAAIMQAVLEKGQTSFKNINADGLQTQNTLQQIKAASQAVGEAFSVAFEKIGGPAVRSFLVAVRDAATFLKESFILHTKGLGDTMAETSVKINNTAETINVLRVKIQEIESGHAGFFEKVFGNPEKSLQLYKKQLNDAQAQMDALQQRKKELVPDSQAGATGGVSTQDKVDKDLQLKQESEFQKEITVLQAQTLKEHIKNEQSTADVDRDIGLERVEAAKETNAKIQQIEAQKAEGKVTASQAAALEEQVARQHIEKMAALDEDLTQRKIKALNNFSMHSKSSADQFAAGWQQSTLQAAQNLDNFSNMGKKAFDALNKNGKSAFIALGDGSKSASDAMKGFVLGSIADMAESQGEFLLASGIGLMNPVQIAEGGALLALSGALRAAAGSASSSLGGGGGGGGSTGSSGIDQVLPSQAQAAQQKTVTVAFNGPYYETDATKQRLLELIRENTDATDFKYQQIGV